VSGQCLILYRVLLGCFFGTFLTLAGVGAGGVAGCGCCFCLGFGPFFSPDFTLVGEAVGASGDGIGGSGGGGSCNC
jgi:hypothetical protein